MCGIAGILLTSSAPNSQPLADLDAMTEALHHRGPDSSGAWLDRDAGIALGHRRLAIVDLSEAGHQPMRSHGDGLVMTFNGEVYNAAELQADLVARGHRFHGHSDTELMLAAFESYGIDAALRRFAGMFALGLWDRSNQMLHLVRDRMGKKPLYVACTDTALLFASELKAIRAFPGFRPVVDRQALAMVLRHGWVPDDHCIFEGVFKLPPGTLLSVCARDLDGIRAGQLRDRARPWWSLAHTAETGQRDPHQASAATLESELDDVLRTAVRERMVADVPLGAFLSGGIDSSTVVALMQAQSSRPIRTFTIGFHEAEYDEAQDAARIAHYLGTEHTEFRVSAADARAVIPDLPRIWDEPFADESQIPTLLVAELARQHVTVALSGDGGDECFGGYARHFMSARIAPVFGLPQGVRAAAAAVLRHLPASGWDRFMAGVPLSSGRRRLLHSETLQRLGRVLDAADEHELYARLATISSVDMTLEPLAAGTDCIPALPDLAARFMYRDMTRYLPGDILVKLDRATMAVSLEARCPLLDHRVVEFAWRVPTSLKIRDGKGKFLLRQVLRRYLPESLFDRPKQGFNVPIGAWLRGPLRDWAEDLLAESRLRRDGYFDPASVQACWREHLGGKRDRSREVWALLMVQAWLDTVHQTPTPAARFTATQCRREHEASCQPPAGRRVP